MADPASVPEQGAEIAVRLFIITINVGSGLLRVLPVLLWAGEVPALQAETVEADSEELPPCCVCETVLPERNDGVEIGADGRAHKEVPGIVQRPCWAAQHDFGVNEEGRTAGD